jgi:ubiquinone/menaquinone biosynthesis C-methylase UbiE
MSTDYAEFNDSRLAEIYDYFCPLTKDSDFFLNEVKKQNPSTILDVGCGSGILTVELSKIAQNVIGVEPAAPMLTIARKRPGSDRVRWINGLATDVTDVEVDIVIMTSHVAQFFLNDDEWRSTLKHIHKLLKTGGKLIFDSRNPIAKPWLAWNKEDTLRSVSTPHGKVNMWYELISTDTEKSRVKHQLHYEFASGKKLVSNNELIYRSKEEIESSLSKAGFEIERVYGYWDGSLADNSSEELIFVAHKP